MNAWQLQFPAKQLDKIKPTTFQHGYWEAQEAPFLLRLADSCWLLSGGEFTFFRGMMSGGMTMDQWMVPHPYVHGQYCLASGGVSDVAQSFLSHLCHAVHLQKSLPDSHLSRTSFITDPFVIFLLCMFSENLLIGLFSFLLHLQCLELYMTCGLSSVLFKNNELQ